MKNTILLVLLALLLVALPGAAGEGGVRARHGMVVSVSPPGTDVGVAILKKGGNAVDAAIATAFALAVTYPAAGNIGGGGFMLVHPAGKGGPVCIEYRETAPAAATKSMFARGASELGHRAVGVPGTVRGMALAHRRFARLPWKDLIMPAVHLAEKGFRLNARLADSLNNLLAAAEDFPELQRVFGKAGGGDWREGDRLVQSDLARTLRLIAEQGPDAFYAGPIARQIAAEMKSGGGLITAADLAAYRAHARRPIHGTYRGHDVYAPPPPSSGGTCLVEMLNILECFDLKKLGRGSPETMHVMIEAMRRAYCDRARYLGDPAFTKIPDHLTDRRQRRARAWRAISPSRPKGIAPRTSPSSTRTAWRSPTPTRWSAVTARASSSREPASCSTTR